MNKQELVKAIAEKAELTNKQAEAALNAAVATLTETMANGDKVTLIGFGTFEVKERAERTSRNPRTGEAMTVPATKLPVFKAGKALKDAVKA